MNTHKMHTNAAQGNPAIVPPEFAEVATICTAAEITIGGRMVIGIPDARDLHAGLEVRRDYATWIKARIEKYGFNEGQDFETFDSPVMGNQTGRGGDRKSKVYRLTLDVAKELAMVENNARGRLIRRYFIWTEQQLAAATAMAANPAAPMPPRPAAPAEVGLASRFVAAREVSAWSRYLYTVSQLFGPEVAAAQYNKTPLPPIDPSMLVQNEVDVPELDGVACLAHLLSLRVSRSNLNLGDLIVNARQSQVLRNSLAEIGIAPAPKGYEDYVAIAADHPRLTRLFVGTDWAANWELALLSLPGARPGNEVGQAFARKRRTVLLPWSLFGVDATAGRTVLQ